MSITRRTARQSRSLFSFRVFTPTTASEIVRKIVEGMTPVRRFAYDGGNGVATRERRRLITQSREFEEGRAAGVREAVLGILGTFSHDGRCGPCGWCRLMNRWWDQWYALASFVNDSEDGEEEPEFAGSKAFTPTAASEVARKMVESLPPLERPAYVGRKAEADSKPIDLMTSPPENMSEADMLPLHGRGP